MRRSLATLCGWTLLLLARPAAALGPHEVLVLINRNSETSIQLGHTFAKLRKVPPNNLVYLALPDKVLETAAEFTPEEFTRFIWEPVQTELRKRMIDDHILAWAYSADFPVRISGDPPWSLQGFTFVRQVPPPADAVRDGTYRSLLFCGPDRQDGPYANSRSLEHFAVTLAKNMPLPSMMLGYAGTRGMTVDQMETVLKYGAMSDGSQPDGNIYLVGGEDVRAKCRAWQFDAAQAEIQSNGVRCAVTTQIPAGEAGLLGIMMGAAGVDPSAMGQFRPGAMADHLTSFGALFHYDDQAKMTAWLRAGAVASAGTVTEPMAIWMKFPAARLFAHYTAGCTALESLYQSIRCPLQILLIGDPLASPWAKPFPLTLIPMQDGEALSGSAQFLATAFADPTKPPPDYLYLLDGRSLATDPAQPTATIDTARLHDGYHELRAVAYAGGDVRQQAFATHGFVVNNRGRVVTMKGLQPGQEIDLRHSVELELEGGADAAELALVSQERVLLRTTNTPRAKVQLAGRLLGPGPQAVQAVAVYPDREAARSAPVPVLVKDLNKPPSISSFATTTNEAGRVQLSFTSSDPEDDEIDAMWGQALGPDHPLNLTQSSADRLAWKDESLILAAPTGMTACAFPLGDTEKLRELSCELLAPISSYRDNPQGVGLVFDFVDDGNYSFFGLFGRPSSWTFGRVQGGIVAVSVTRGTYYVDYTWQRVSLRGLADGGVEARVNDRELAQWREGNLRGGRIGVFGASGEFGFRKLTIAPALALEQEVTIDGTTAEGPSHESLRRLRLMATARDAWTRTVAPVP